MAKLTGKVALVTGAASGLGKADAEMLAKSGATVYLTDVNDSAGKKAAAAINKKYKNKRAHYIHHDVASEKNWKSVIASIKRRSKRLDVLVNNAGVVVVATPETTTLKEFRFANSIMSEGVFLGCKYAIPLMKEKGGGSIINMSSVASHVGYPVFFAYSAAKGAVRSMTKSIAVHCQAMGYNIRCNSVHPSSIDTPMIAEANEKLGINPDDAADGDMIGVGSADDVANLVVFLASKESKFINGSELVIDNSLTVNPL